MALEGTLQDFGLAEIFQLIALQKKSGVLTLRGAEDEVSVSFETGNIVYADSRTRNVENRLGAVLVKTGKISEEQLEEALRLQKQTLQRLGHVLVDRRYISQDELREALQLQVTQTVYRLFRWKAGDYHFDQIDNLDYDRENGTFISAQNLLMEGVRMLDEWPLLEKKIPSLDLVYRKTDPSLLVEALAEEDGGDDDDFDLGLGLDGSLAPASAPEDDGVTRVSPRAARVYEVIDGASDVNELCDRVQLGEFDTCRSLYELLEQGAIEPVEGAAAAAARPARSRRRRGTGSLVWLGYLALAVVLAASVATMDRNPLNLIPIPVDESPTVDAFRRLVSRNRVDRLDRALYLYFLENRRLADGLRNLVHENFVEAVAIRDPWGRRYAYQALPDGYRVVGYDNGGVEDPTLSRVRRFPTGLLPRP